MTVASAISRVSYAGNGSTTAFSVPYYFLENSHLQVILSVGGVDTVQTITTNYTVTGAGNQAGGTVTMTVAPAMGTQLTILRDVPATQETDYTANDPFPAESHERALDKLTMLVQENDVRAARAVRGPVTDSESINMILPAAADRADGILQFDTNGAANVVSTDQFIAGLANSVIGANYVTVSATGNGVTTAFTVSPAPGAKGNIQIYIDGVYQNKATFSLSGTTVTFTEAPPFNSQIEFVIGSSIGSTSGNATGIDFTQQGTGAVSRTVANKFYEMVSVKDFGAVGDGVTDDTAAIQAALNASLSVNFGDSSNNYLITSPLTMQPVGKIYAEGASIIAGAVMTAALIRASNTKVVGLRIDCGNYPNVAGVAPVVQYGALAGMQFLEINSTSTQDCIVTRYIFGYYIISRTAGVKCYDHEFVNCTAFSGPAPTFTFNDLNTSNAQFGLQAGSETSAFPSDPTAWTQAMYDEASDVYDIRVVNFRAIGGQYGVSLRRASRCSVIGGTFKWMSRAVSIQHQCRQVTVQGATIYDVNTSGVHCAQGTSHVEIQGCTFRGVTGLNTDSTHVQAQFTVSDIYIIGNSFDSQFNLWDGGIWGQQRIPFRAIRVANKAERVHIIGNNIRGYQTGIALWSVSNVTFFAADPTNVNYYNTGFRDIYIHNNIILGDYFNAVATTYKLVMVQSSNVRGIYSFINGTWEDTTLGGWDIANISVKNNIVEDTTNNYVVERVSGMTSGDAPVYLTNAVLFADNKSVNPFNTDLLRVLTAENTIFSDRNTWVDSTQGTWTASFKAGGVEWTTETGVWKRVGNMVTLSVSFISVFPSGPTGLFTITGIPFASGTTGAVGAVYWRGLGTGVTKAVVPVIAASSSTIMMIENDQSGGTTTNVNAEQLFVFNNTGNNYFTMTISYFV